MKNQVFVDRNDVSFSIALSTNFDKTSKKYFLENKRTDVSESEPYLLLLYSNMQYLRVILIKYNCEAIQKIAHQK